MPLQLRTLSEWAPWTRPTASRTRCTSATFTTNSSGSTVCAPQSPNSRGLQPESSPSSPLLPVTKRRTRTARLLLARSSGVRRCPKKGWSRSYRDHKGGRKLECRQTQTGASLWQTHPQHVSCQSSLSHCSYHACLFSCTEAPIPLPPSKMCFCGFCFLLNMYLVYKKKKEEKAIHFTWLS